MVGDYISRSALRDSVDEIIKVNHLHPDYVWFTPNGVKALALEIPAADVAPVRHASWIEDGYYNEPCVCSYCGEPCKDTVMGKPRWIYCPLCGSKNQEGSP